MRRRDNVRSHLQTRRTNDLRRGSRETSHTIREHESSCGTRNRPSRSRRARGTRHTRTRGSCGTGHTRTGGSRGSCLSRGTRLSRGANFTRITRSTGGTRITWESLGTLRSCRSRGTGRTRRSRNSGRSRGTLDSRRANEHSLIRDITRILVSRLRTRLTRTRSRVEIDLASRDENKFSHLTSRGTRREIGEGIDLCKDRKTLSGVTLGSRGSGGTRHTRGTGVSGCSLNTTLGT